MSSRRSIVWPFIFVAPDERCPYGQFEQPTARSGCEQTRRPKRAARKRALNSRRSIVWFFIFIAGNERKGDSSVTLTNRKRLPLARHLPCREGPAIRPVGKSCYIWYLSLGNRPISACPRSDLPYKGKDESPRRSLGAACLFVLSLERAPRSLPYREWCQTAQAPCG